MLIGLTGGIGAGKSVVAETLAEQGALIVDSDQLSREAMRPGGAAVEAVARRFGPDVLDSAGGLDRTRLAEIVFADKGARRDLEAIVHPFVRAARAELERSGADAPAIVRVIPLLVETGLDAEVDEVVVVDAPLETRIERLARRDAMTRQEALARIGAQASRRERLAKATWVIDNSGDLDAARRGALEFWRERVAPRTRRPPG